MRTKRAFKVKEKVFFFNFERLSVTKKCLRPENATLNILAFKVGLLYNFTKTLMGCHFMKHSRWVWSFQLLLICKSSKLFSYILLKHMSKMPYFGHKWKRFFFKFCLLFKGPPIWYHKVYIVTFCNTPHLEMTFFKICIKKW